ncbi:AAA family ATPase [Streptomyces sp. NRRL S-495]|uniref:AAA family ATPase n=1 Tax=Streptomyces sp. NRRL S-495 TaxID=1609133 RepID=UPI0005F8C68D|nr:AAA family ATPase [Streptomyces sp. NRRL S-495]KJY32145.1 ATPase [Streptomyces sp. NRRL S-495]
MTGTEFDVGVKQDHPGWRPDVLRDYRVRHGLTLEDAGERLREIAQQASIQVPAANFQTLSQHETGEGYPSVLYRRVYRLLYGASDWELGFRAPLPHEKSELPLTPHRSRVNDGHTLAVEEALLQISGNGGADSHGVQLRIMDAWRRRHTGGDPHRPTLILVGGYAGSGKSEFAKFVSQLTGWPVLDKDPMSRALVEGMLTALGLDPNDRHSETYLEKVRPLEYDCLMKAAMMNVECGISTVLTAPFIREMTNVGWMSRLSNRCRALGVTVAPIWVMCDPESMYEYISHRSAARDSWKLSTWDEYIKGIDADLRPAVPHLTVDNRWGTAISLADRARLALGSLYV